MKNKNKEHTGDYEKGYQQGVQDSLLHARQVIVQNLTTAEKWRYDRIVRDFAIMLGELDETVLNNWDPIDYLRDQQISYAELRIGDMYASWLPQKSKQFSECRFFDGTLTVEEQEHIEDLELFLIARC